MELSTYHESIMENLLSKLKVLTEQIVENPDHNPFVIDSNRIMQLKCEFGKAYSIGIYTNFNIAIALTVFEECTAIPPHHHTELEVVMVLEGELAIMFCDATLDEPKVHKVKQHECFQIPINVKHSAVCAEKTKFIACTLPASPYFPIPQNENYDAI